MGSEVQVFEGDGNDPARNELAMNALAVAGRMKQARNNLLCAMDLLLDRADLAADPPVLGMLRAVRQGRATVQILEDLMSELSAIAEAAHAADDHPAEKVLSKAIDGCKMLVGRG